MDDQLLALLDYDGVLSALAATPDGLVVAAAGLRSDDAEIVGAAGSMLFSSADDAGRMSGTADIGSASIHLFRGAELSLVVLTEVSTPHDALGEVVGEALESASRMFA